MSLKARRLSKSKSAEELLEKPKIRDKSKQPTIMIKRNGQCIYAIPIVGKLVYGVGSIFNERTTRYNGECYCWEKELSYETPVLIMEIGSHAVKVLVNIYAGDIFLKSITGLVARTDFDSHIDVYDYV